MSRTRLPLRESVAGSAVVIFVIATLLLATASPVDATDTVVRTVKNETVSVQTPRMPTGLSAKSGVVIDAVTRRTLWAMRERDVRLIASTTKLMTALVAVNETTPNQKLTATSYRHDAAESLLGLVPGERMTVRDLLHALLLVSANDAADTFAARLGGRGDFVDKMNRRAAALGMSDTHFGNAVGLDTPRTESSARDLAKLGVAAMSEPRLRAIVGRKSATLRSGVRVRRIVNRNRLVRRHAFVDGVKTGHTMRAGYLLVGAAHKGDARIISVVMGEPSEAARDRDSLKLLRFGRGFFKPVTAVARDRVLTRIPVALQDRRAAVYSKRRIALALRDRERLSVRLSAPKELEGPLRAGTRVGTAAVIRNGRQVDRVAVYLREAVPEPPIAAVLLKLLRDLLPMVLILLIAFMIGLLVLRRRSANGSGRYVRSAARGSSTA